MDPLCIVKIQVPTDPFTGLSGTRVFVEVDLFILETAPEPLREDVVSVSALAVHADLYACCLEQANVGGAGEVAALVAVHDGGLSCGERPLHGFKHEGHLQGLIELPGYHIPGVPVQDCDEVEPPPLESDIGDVNPPNVIGASDLETSE